MLLGRPVTVRVEVAAGAHVKRHASGRLHYVSPVSSPFAYGCVPGEPAPDGDLQDALLLGLRPAPHQEVGGVVLPETFRTFKWTDGAPGELVTNSKMTDVSFEPGREASWFEAPEGARVIEGM